MDSGWIVSPTGVPSQAQGAYEPDSRARSMLGWLRDTAGGYLGPELSRHTPSQRNIQEEKSKAGPLGILLPWFLPYVDDLTQETASIRAEYRRMLRDPNVKAAVLDKLLSVASLDLQVQPDGDGPQAQRVAQFVKDNLTRRLHGGVRRLVEAPGLCMLIDGYSVSEKVWKLETKGQWAGKWVLRNLKTKDTNNDVVLLTDEYRNIVGIQGLRYNAGQVFSPANFLILQHLSLYETPTGMSDFRAAYRAYWMIDTTTKLRAIGLEKRSVPILIGTYATQQQKPSLEAALALAKSAAWLSIPEGVKVQALEVAARSQDEFANAIKDWKHDIFLGIAGAVLQALEGQTTDGRGNSQVHQDTASIFKWYVSTLIQTGLNDPEAGLIPDMVDLNFAGAGYPYATLSAIDPDRQTAQLKIFTGLHQIGLDLSKKQLQEEMAVNPPADRDDTLPGAPPQPQKPQPNAPAGAGGGGASSLKEVTTAPEPGEAPAEPFCFADEWRNYVRGASWTSPPVPPDRRPGQRHRPRPRVARSQ